MVKNKSPHKLKFAIIATDIVLFTIAQGELKVLLIPITSLSKYKKYWSLPGGLIHPKETADKAAKRHLRDKAGARYTYMEQLYTFSKIDRDPMGRVVAIAYLSVVPHTKMELKKSSDAKWFLVKNLPRLAYDHREIIKRAIERLRGKLEYTNIAYAMVSEEFSMDDLQKIYEIVLGKKLDKRNFQKKIFSLNILKPLNKIKKGVPYRPPRLYMFKDKKIKTIETI